MLLMRYRTDIFLTLTSLKQRSEKASLGLGVNFLCLSQVKHSLDLSSRCLQDKYDMRIFRLCSLWLDNSHEPIVNQIMKVGLMTKFGYP